MQLQQCHAETLSTNGLFKRLCDCQTLFFVCWRTKNVSCIYFSIINVANTILATTRRRYFVFYKPILWNQCAFRWTLFHCHKLRFAVSLVGRNFNALLIPSTLGIFLDVHIYFSLISVAGAYCRSSPVCRLYILNICQLVSKTNDRQTCCKVVASYFKLLLTSKI